MIQTLIGIGILGLLGAIAWALVEAIAEEGLRQHISRRWPRLWTWWTTGGGLYLRFSVLLVFFAGSAVGFGLVTVGVSGGAGRQPVGWIIVLPMAGMSLWCLYRLYAIRPGRSAAEGYRRSSDGSWSAG